MKTYIEKKEFFSQNNKLNKGYKTAKQDPIPQQPRHNENKKTDNNSVNTIPYRYVFYGIMIFILGVGVGLSFKV